MSDDVEYLTDEQLASISGVIDNLYYVYFVDGGKIDAITNEKRENSPLNFIKVEYNRIEKFLVGKENFSEYIVSLIDKDTPVIVKPSESISANTHWLSKITQPPKDNTTLTVVWNSVNKTWNFSINESSRNQIKQIGLTAQLLFFVTVSSNPNFLIRTISIDMLDISSTTEIQIPWISELEQDYYSVSISTRRFFESYGILKYEQD
jgi:hypothetical protein